jgi:hypothetical protein
MHENGRVLMAFRSASLILVRVGQAFLEFTLAGPFCRESDVPVQNANRSRLLSLGQLCASVASKHCDTVCACQAYRPA